ncbi:hypothetical protein MAJ_11215, partial [Metarhizium majus ARSEF 297]
MSDVKANSQVDPAAETHTAIGEAIADVSGENIWPEELKEHDENPEDKTDKILEYVRKQHAYYESIGAPFPHVTRAAPAAATPDSLGTVYIALTREVPAGRPEKPTTYRMRGNIRLGVDMVIVPEEEVAALEAQGWEV